MIHMKPHAVTAILPLALLALVSCAPTINQGAFTTFQSSISSVKTSSESVTTTFVTNEQTLHLQQLAENDAKPQDEVATLSPGNGTMAITNSDQSQADFQAMLEAVVRYNSALLSYSELLNKLADPSLAGNSSLQTDATTIATQSAKVLTDLKPYGVNVTKAQQTTGIIATAFTAAVGLYLADKQAAALTEAIQKNQDSVEQYSIAGEELVHQCLEQIEPMYTHEHATIVAAFVGVVNANHKPTPAIDPTDYIAAWGRATPAERMTYLQSEYSAESGVEAQVKTLESLYQTYKALPAAHADLAKSIKSPQANLSGISSLYTQAQNLVQLYEASQKAATASTTTTPTK
jgi:hypothetical protein